jgi:hypothetical protein
LVGVVYDEGMWLAKLDPKSLAPISAPHVRTSGGEFGVAVWSIIQAPWTLMPVAAFSPDRSQLALGDSTDRNRPAGLRLLRTQPLRTLARITLGHSLSVLATAWPRSRRIVAVGAPSCCLRRPSVFVIDPIRRSVVARYSLRRATLVATAPTANGLALLLGPSGRIGEARLVLAAVDRPPKTLVLGGVLAGSYGPHRYVRPTGRIAVPGLTIDALRDRAFVVPADGPAVEVDLQTMRASYHELERPVSLLGRIHDWLEPKAYADAPQRRGPVRLAAWLGNDLIAVSGWDRGASSAFVSSADVVMPAGLHLINTRRWRVQTLNDHASGFVRVGRRIVAYGYSLGSSAGGPRGIGLVAYDLDGKRRWHLLGKRALIPVSAYGNYVYAWTPQGVEGSQEFIVDVTRGRIVSSRLRPLGAPTLLSKTIP